MPEDEKGLAEELVTAEQQDTSRKHPKRVDWDGESGTIDTGPVEEDFDPQDFDAILRHHNLDPERFYIVGSCGFTAWDQWTRDGTYRQLRAYRFRFLERGFAVDLPALYAEMGKPQKKPLKHAEGESTVVVAWADIQTGKVDYLGGLTELLERLEAKRSALKAYLRKEKFDHIVVCDVGDIIEGFDNIKSQIRTNCLSIMDQVDVAATEFWKTIRLCERFAPVSVLSIPSNHAQWRQGGKDLAGLPTDDWGLHISKRLERQNEDAGLRVTFHRPDDWCETLTFDVRGTRLGLAHGHKASNPDRVRDWWAKLSHAGVLTCDVLLTGHFHFASMRPSGRNAVTGKAQYHLQAPTLDNGSAWVRNKYGDDGDPGLMVFQISDEGFDLCSLRVL